MPLYEAWLRAPGQKLIRPNRADRLLEEAFDANVLATVANTGPRVSEAQMQNYSGDLVNVTPGTVIDRKILTGRVSPNAADVVFQDCINKGPTDTAKQTAAQGLFDFSGSGNLRVRVEYCETSPQDLVWQTVGICGHDFTTLRNHVHDSVDGVRLRNTTVAQGANVNLNVLMRGDLIEDFGFYTPAGHSDNMTHNDGLQIENGQGIILRGVRIRAYCSQTRGQASTDGTWDDANQKATGDGNPFWPAMQALSCIITTPNWGPVGGLELDRVRLEGGYAKLNIADNTYGFTDGTMHDCTLTPDGLDTRSYRSGGYDWRTKPFAGSAWSKLARTANTWTDSGGAANDNSRVAA